MVKKGVKGVAIAIIVAAVITAVAVTVGVVVSRGKNDGEGGENGSSSSPSSSYVGESRMVMQESSSGRRRSLQAGSGVGSWSQFLINSSGGSPTLWWASDSGLHPPYSSRETPTLLEGIITYATVSESGEDLSAPCLGDDPDRGWNFCPPQGGCCVNAIIFENPSCCKDGYTPSLENVDYCTFDALDSTGCQADCSLTATNDDVREGCRNWYGPNTFGPRSTDFVDFAAGESQVNAELGSTVLPLLRDTFLPFAQAGGTFKSVGVMWGGGGVGTGSPGVNWRFSAPSFDGGSDPLEFTWHVSSTYYFTDEEQIGVEPGAALRFALEYDPTDMVYLWNFSDPDAISALDEDNDGLIDLDLDSALNCQQNADGLHVCLNLDMLDDMFIPHAEIVPGESLYNSTEAS